MYVHCSVCMNFHKLCKTRESKQCSSQKGILSLVCDCTYRKIIFLITIFLITEFNLDFSLPFSVLRASSCVPSLWIRNAWQVSKSGCMGGSMYFSLSCTNWKIQLIQLMQIVAICQLKENMENSLKRLVITSKIHFQTTSMFTCKPKGEFYTGSNVELHMCRT